MGQPWLSGHLTFVRVTGEGLTLIYLYVLTSIWQNEAAVSRIQNWLLITIRGTIETKPYLHIWRQWKVKRLSDHLSQKSVWHILIDIAFHRSISSDTETTKGKETKSQTLPLWKWRQKTTSFNVLAAIKHSALAFNNNPPVLYDFANWPHAQLDAWNPFFGKHVIKSKGEI